MDRKGFSLIELMVVVAVIAILAAVAIPGYIGQQKRAARTEAYSTLETIRLLEEQFFAENGDYAPNSGTLGTCAKDNNPANITAIQNTISGFRPGSDLSFSYCIEADVDVTGAATAPNPCFRARAFGNSGTRTDGDVFAIDCNNERTF
jgi:type IV pilus assembly protein PilE